MKKRFFLYVDALDVINDLSLKERGELLTAIYKHHKEEPCELSPLVKVAFTPIRNQFIRDDNAYQEICESKRKNANKRWSKDEDDANAYKSMQLHANECNSMQNDATDADMTRHDMTSIDKTRQDNKDKISLDKNTVGEDKGKSKEENAQELEFRLQ